jgi:hypothetical protein
MYRMYLIFLFGFFLLGMGCGRSKTYIGPDGEKTVVTQKGDNTEVTFTGNKGEKVLFSSNEQGVPLPDNFPKDAPIYPGATITMNSSTPDGMMVMLKTKDSLKQVKEFYQNKLKEQGWEQETSFNTRQGATLANTKGDRTLAVTISSGEETIIQLIAMPEKAN